MKKDILEYNNAHCLNCGIVRSTMVRVGPMVFCNPCLVDEFSDIDKYDTNSNEYKKWIKIYKES